MDNNILKPEYLKMKERLAVFLFSILSIFFINIKAYTQIFNASALLGMNASQIDGDGYFGYDRLGWHAGGRLSVRAGKRQDISLEMLYSERGSSSSLFNSPDSARFSLSYLEVPVIFSVKDWFLEKENYHKVRVDAGLSGGYLFGTKVPKFEENDYRKLDLTWLVGIGFHFQKHIACSIRYTNSIFDLLQKEVNGNNVTFRSYFLTFRISNANEYKNLISLPFNSYHFDKLILTK